MTGNAGKIRKIAGSDSREGVLSEKFCRGLTWIPASAGANAGEKDRIAQPRKRCAEFILLP